MDPGDTVGPRGLLEWKRNTGGPSGPVRYLDFLAVGATQEATSGLLWPLAIPPPSNCTPLPGQYLPKIALTKYSRLISRY